MNSNSEPHISNHIVEKTKSFGASLAGLADMASLKTSPSFKLHGEFEWPPEARSVLVFALIHEMTEPELDWWDDLKGGSPGNRRLIEVAKSSAKWIKKEYDINVNTLSYHIEKGGIYLKDAAALAGLGIIGVNNILVTPEFGPRVRLRAMLLEKDLVPTGPIDFSPCEPCDKPCIQSCPQNSFTDGSYTREICRKQMNIDEANRLVFDKSSRNDSPGVCVKYCRACELACPIGK